MTKKKALCAILALAIALATAPAMPTHAALKTVNANTAEELENAIASNTEIILSDTTYTFEDFLSIFEIENLVITGTSGTEIVGLSHENNIIIVDNSRGITISNVSLGHDIPQELSCSSSVIAINYSEDITFERCDIYGSGETGFNMMDSTAKFNECTIRDCTKDILAVMDSIVELNNCTIKDNGKKNDPNGRDIIYDEGKYIESIDTKGIYIDHDDNYNSVHYPQVTFNSCEFINNNNTYFKSEYYGKRYGESNYYEIIIVGNEGSYNTGLTKANNCTFTGNTWQQDSPTLPATPFTDFNTNDWFAYDVLNAYGLRLINGTTPTTFAPNNNLTYAEAVKLAACMHELYTTGTITLSDSSAVWYQTYVDYAKKNSIIDKDYDWKSPATRAGYIEIFANALPNEALAPINTVADGAIPDVQMTHPQASAIYKLYRAGILQGIDAAYNCNPTSNIRRSEVAVILTRMMDKSARVKFSI